MPPNMEEMRWLLQSAVRWTGTEGKATRIIRAMIEEIMRVREENEDLKKEIEKKQ